MRDAQNSGSYVRHLWGSGRAEARHSGVAQWPSARFARSTATYRPGHQVDWIQAKKAVEDQQPVIDVAVVVHDDGHVDNEADDLNLTLWHHDPDRLRSAVDHWGRAVWKPRYHVLSLPELFGYVFNMAALQERTPCKPGGAPHEQLVPAALGGEPCRLATTGVGKMWANPGQPSSQCEANMPFNGSKSLNPGVRAEGLEPSSSLEHRHLKPACLPSFITPAAW